MRLPDFICIGAMRCGTTTLWKMMKGMSDIYLPETKELHFFDRCFDEGISFYSSFFNSASPSHICGEFTPNYLPSKECCRRIRNVLPAAKLLVIIRNPVFRAWSHYRYSVCWGPETLSLEKALQREETRIEKGGYREVYYSYKKRGQYIDQLLAYESAFSRDNIHLVFLEDLVRDKEQVLNRIRNHIGLAPLKEMPSIRLTHENKLSQFPNSLHLHQLTRNLIKLYQGHSILHRGIRKISKLIQQRNLLDTSPELSEKVEYQLTKYYEPFDARLEAWLGRPLPWRMGI